MAASGLPVAAEAAAAPMDERDHVSVSSLQSPGGIAGGESLAEQLG